MKNVFPFCIVVLNLFFFATSHAQDAIVKTEKGPENLHVLELFTSQGCHSCPPADDLLGKLSNNSAYITISCHVTYWDYLGWKDSFSLEFCDKRQRQYNAYMQTDTNYTPQLIIDGRFQTVGSREYRVNNALFRANKRPKLIPIDLSRNSRSLMIDISKTLKEKENPRELELSILGLGKTQFVDIPRGENGGKKLEYHNPLLFAYTKELNNETSARIVENIEKHKNIRHWVVLANEIETGRIFAAGRINDSKPN